MLAIYYQPLDHSSRTASKFLLPDVDVVSPKCPNCARCDSAHRSHSGLE